MPAMTSLVSEARALADEYTNHPSAVILDALADKLELVYKVVYADISDMARVSAVRLFVEED